MMTEDRWMRAALINETLVAELLLRLKTSSCNDVAAAAKLPKTPLYESLLPLPIGWGHHQPRSKPPPSTTTTTTTTTTTSCKQQTRCSPTTPLSWSGASTSDGGYDNDNSSRRSDRSDADRSKAAFPTESATATANKKSRKRKTFAELKEEEGILLRERTHLKKEIASMQVTFKEQMSRSANLKRVKLDLHLQSGSKMVKPADESAATISNQCNSMEASSSFDHANSILPRHSIHNNQASIESCKVEKDSKTQERGFVLPDLNMLPDLNTIPTEEEPGAELLYVMS